MKWFTAALLTVAAVLGGLLIYRNEAQASAVLHGTSLDPAKLVGALPLTRDDGQAVNVGGPAAQVRLVFFGFTRCPDVCPLTLGLLAKTYNGLSAEQRKAVLVQLVSVDPQHDQPAVLRAYLNNFSADFRGFTGTPEKAKAAADAFYVLSTRAADGTILHGEQVAVLDRQGRFRRVYNGDSLRNGDLGADLPGMMKTY
ncbi:SCO family protein [Deinococcus sp.]|uniref:SCO family protein n=1 Tax=Deinococcus sp. TaxID=47478 RepID=UPI0025DD1606|nr:SCO family protein [Deinococcus sp.]